MDYQAQLPEHPLLKEAVCSFWQVSRHNRTLRSETIIPKGIIEVIFSFHEAPDVCAQLGRQQLLMPRCSINGYNTLPIQLQLPDRQTFFGVVFYPTVIRHLFRVPAGEFANHCVDMTLVDASVNALWHQMAEAGTFARRVDLVSDWLMTRLTGLTRQEQLFNRFLTDKTGALLAVSEVARQLCYSPRQLARKLRDLTGLNTEETLLYKKYLKSVELMHHSTLSLTEIAHACQFADQSHFIKAFRSFAQLTPGEYRNRKSFVAGHLYEEVR